MLGDHMARRRRVVVVFFFSSRRRHTRFDCDWSSDVCSSDLADQRYLARLDLKEELVHSLQKYVEVDEPEPSQVPLIGAPGASVDADDTEEIGRASCRERV